VNVICSFISINRIVLLGMTLFVANPAVYADDGQVEIDKARVFPAQRNTTVIHSSNKEVADPNSESSVDLADKQNAPPKDTSLVINGNGGSTNRPAGGNATLRKRFTFD
jgi:hypothetical protein